MIVLIEASTSPLFRFDCTKSVFDDLYGCCITRNGPSNHVTIIAIGIKFFENLLLKERHIRMQTTNIFNNLRQNFFVSEVGIPLARSG